MIFFLGLCLSLVLVYGSWYEVVYFLHTTHTLLWTSCAGIYFLDGENCSEVVPKRSFLLVYASRIITLSQLFFSSWWMWCAVFLLLIYFCIECTLYLPSSGFPIKCANLCVNQVQKQWKKEKEKGTKKFPWTLSSLCWNLWKYGCVLPLSVYRLFIHSSWPKLLISILCCCNSSFC